MANYSMALILFTGWLLTASRQSVNQCIGEYGEHKERNEVACQISQTSNHIF